MTIHDLIDPNSIALHNDSTIADAAQLLLETKLSALPVVDAGGRYLGIFSINRLLSLLLPRAALIEGGVSDLGFVSDAMETLCEKMGEQGSRLISEVLEKDARVAYPDTPLLELVLHLYRGENDIPVVDKTSHHFIGTITSAHLLAKVCQGVNNAQ
ncbi:MAG: CBS domain-containing protein [Gallionella sp.]|nr:CBS domain-containing protein [Gallionella sp.]MDD4958563.1 CBS domain-containing protein [Gallionella sp.]